MVINMKNKYTKIINNQLFDKIDEKDLQGILTCLGAFEKIYSKNEIIVNEGDRINFVGIVIEGGVKILKTDYNGNEVIIAEVANGEMFAEVFACAEILKSPVSITATTNSCVMFFDYKKIISSCSSSCSFHQQLILNMIGILAKKSLYLNRRIDIISKRTLRDKILTYLNYERGGLNKFCISMNREEMANFLCADRSAVSNELAKMKKDGIINYKKNEFTIIN